jgi:hypothetical protein
MPNRRNFPFHEGEFQFLSSFHWYPLVNGYSGNWSDRHVAFLERVQDFPDEEAIGSLREAGVKYVLVHERYLGRDQFAQTVARLDDRLTAGGKFPDDGYEIAAYVMR